VTMTYESRTRKTGDPPLSLVLIFQDLLHRYVSKLTIRGTRATGCCPLHEDRHPSFSGDLERCIWHCFGCGQGGGVRALACVLGEPWTSTRSESRTANARRARFQAERQARVILERRVEDRDLILCAEHRELYGEALAAADLLSLFHRRPDLAAEFSELVLQTEREYGEALFRCTVLEARLDREVAA
jgi:CHC2 zinc finger